MKNPFRTLQGRFTLYLSLLIVAMMSALAFWNISREKALMEEAIAREGKALAESFAISCTNTMLYEEVGFVEEGGLLDNYISDLMQRKTLDMVYAMLLDTHGKVIAHNSLVEVGNVYQDQVTRQALASWNTLLQYPSPMLLDISTPLAISTKRWGTLRLGISTENLKKEVSSLVWKYTLYTLGVILLTTSLIVFLFGFITNPLKSLSKEMDRASTQNHPFPVPSKREDEIGSLQRSFYRMLERIGENEKERERTQRNLFLTEKMVAIGKLTAGMAHEINNPLGGILNCIYHFKKGIPSPERQREYLDLMEDGIKRIQKTVTNLLEYARNPHSERSSLEVGPLIEKALSLVDYQIRKNGISIERDISSNIPPIYADRDQMGQVLVNILLNAIQAMEQGGILTVNARNIAEKLLITVSDTGGGIPDDVLPSVFDPFFTTKGEGKGTGLGLWISQGMIERHGGTIQVLSKEAKGTTVEIQLPMQSTQERGL
jgi:two-component system NtrC family sensor kinase